MKRKILIGFLVFCAFVALTAVRVVTSSRSEHLRGGRYLERGNMEAAIVHFRRSARWYAPGNPYVIRSYKKLWYLGREAERRGDRKTAFSAYRSIRGAILGCRSFYTPHSHWLPRVNKHISQLMAEQQMKRVRSHEQLEDHPAFRQKTRKGKKRKGFSKQDEQVAVSPQEKRKLLERWHYEQLRKTTAPSVGWSILAVLGLLVWIGGGFAFAYRAITPEDKISPKRAAFWGAVIIVGLLVWMIGLSLA